MIYIGNVLSSQLPIILIQQHVLINIKPFHCSKVTYYEIKNVIEEVYVFYTARSIPLGSYNTDSPDAILTQPGIIPNVIKIS